MASPQSSFTAFIIVHSLAKLSLTPRWRDFFSEDARILNAGLANHARTTWIRRLFSMLPLRLYCWIMDFFYIPGIVHHFMFRKRFIEQQANEAIARGATQIMILGAGFDTLALRLAKRYPATTCVEIDRAPTQQEKQRCLNAMRYPIPANFRFNVADLTDSAFADHMRAIENLDMAKPTLIIIEGVLIYLRKQEVERLFTSLRTLFKGPLRIVFGATVASDNEGNWRLRMINWLLHKNNESTYWYCPSRDMAAFISSLGFMLLETVHYRELQKDCRTLQELDGIPMEDENYYVISTPQAGNAKR